MYKKFFKQMCFHVTLVLSLLSSPEQQFDFSLLECPTPPPIPHSPLLTLIPTSLRKQRQSEENLHMLLASLPLTHISAQELCLHSCY